MDINIGYVVTTSFVDQQKEEQPSPNKSQCKEWEQRRKNDLQRRHRARQRKKELLARLREEAGRGH